MSCPAPDKGKNFISEWFGHRLYPKVLSSAESSRDQSAGRCPFLSEFTGREHPCTKAPASHGVCTISSASNGRRQDWLVCPNRALVPSIVNRGAHLLFAARSPDWPKVVPAPNLQFAETRKDIEADLADGRKVLVAFQEKLGGEISIPGTDRSPEISFDITLVELQRDKGRWGIGRFGILEVQTMDFHGTYRNAVKNLKDALRLHAHNFSRTIQENPHWLGEKIEGPNKANVFKRTFYQLVFKFQLGMHKRCAGCILAIPTSVWDSWQPHLGKPDLRRQNDGNFLLAEPTGRRMSGAVHKASALIHVFEPQSESARSPNPLSVQKTIVTDADSIAYYALKVAPLAAVGESGMIDLIPARIRARLAQWWQELAVTE